MINNNICESYKLATPPTTQVALKSAASKTANTKDEMDNIVAGMANGLTQQTTYEYENDIWFGGIIDKTVKANSTKTTNNNCSNKNNNNQTNVVNRNVWLSNRMDILREQQQQQQQQQQNYTANKTLTNNNESDIIIADMENEFDDDADEEKKQTATIVTPKYYMESNMKFCRKPTSTSTSTSIPPPPAPRTTLTDNSNMKGNIITNKTDVIYHDRNVNLRLIEDNDNINDHHNDDDVDDDDDNSLASMETLSDNVSIWIDGEKHWVAGVDAHTTCAELIWALLNYQNGQQTKKQLQQQQQQHQQQHMSATEIPLTKQENITATIANKANSQQQKQLQQHKLPNQQQQQEQQHHQQLPKLYDKHAAELNTSSSTTNQVNNTSLCNGNKPNLNQNNVNNITSTNNCNNVNYTIAASNTTSTTTTIITAINQSMPINTKENCKIIPNSTRTVESATTAATLPPTLLPLTLPPGITTVSQLATEYVIVKQYHHCEEYLDGSTKVFDVLPPPLPRYGAQKRQCELLLRHLGPAPSMYVNNTTPQLSSLISTDKDSGMGSPVGSARSAKLRRRKHKSSQWLAQANTLHPKLSRCTANERLMKIILAQDETIQRQLSLLCEKERQITKIEEEKHRKRERELGKNYLLETYLNGLDEAECEPEVQDGEEIFIDEPYQRQAATTTAPFTEIPGTAITSKITATTEEPLAVDAVAEVFNAKARHKPKEKDMKKEKKKKRHKEKSTTKAEALHATKDLNGKINKNKDKEKHSDLNANTKDTAGTEQEIEMQILWLEKIYTLNKQLQKEEELAAKLHAKVRKHQLRKAQQTQQEVQMEIDKLDNNLALQCGDIRKVEANLMQTNEQLQKKLLLLERLSVDYLQQQQQQQQQYQQPPEDFKQQDDIKEILKTEISKEPQKENPLKNESNKILTNLEKSLDIQKLSLNNINSKEEVRKLEKIIAKPSIDLHKSITEVKETKQAATAVTHNTRNDNQNAMEATNSTSNYIPVYKMPHNQTVSNEHTNRLNEMRANFMNDTFNLTNCNAINAAADNQQQTLIMLPQLLTPPTTGATSADYAATSLAGTAATKTKTLSASNGSVDKNMLSSLHVQNAKTIKKQMFHTQTTAVTQQKVIVPTVQTATLAAFPKQQFQHQIPQQHIPITASTFLTSRPQNSHQIPTILPAPSHIVLVQQHASSLATIASSSSSPLCESSALIASKPPPTSTSPSPSIMAMNTVDISQLGTLV